MNQILYGVGNAVLRDFTDSTKIVALSKLKNLSVEASASDEKLYGGDSPYPLATFPKDKGIKVSAENATFDMAMVSVGVGGEVATGAVTFTEIETYLIPDDGIVMLKFEPTASTLIVDGFTSTETTVATGQYKQDDTEKDKLTFAVADKGKEVNIIYERTSGATTQTLSILKETMAKTFKFIHRIPIYDDNNAVVGQGQLVIYKCKANNAFTFGLQPQTAFSPKIELEALECKRPDGKLWDFSIDPVTP